MTELSQTLSHHKGKGYVIAPAGFGKTHLIAEAVQAGVGRYLILTHTYAGVNALKTKMRNLEVAASKFQVDTIASWTLRLCLAYPKNSDWNIEQPNNNQWAQLYNVSSSLLAKEFIRRIIQASYVGVYVDEYQDCSKSQHTMITALAELLPCCVLGDPLQAVFDFAEESVEWDKDIYPHFTCLGVLTKPWRWHNAGAHALGDWLTVVRQKLERDEQFCLSAPLPTGIVFHYVDSGDAQNKKQISTCCYFRLRDGEKAIAIHKGSAAFKNKGHKLAHRLSGKFSSIEEIEGVALSAFVKKISNAIAPASRLKIAIEFAAKCMTGVNAALSAGTTRGEIVIITQRTNHHSVVKSANNYLNDPSSAKLKSFLTNLKVIPEVKIFRRDLLNRTMQVLTIHSQSPSLTLEEAANKYQSEFRHIGRPVTYPKLIGTTLLVKGLEFDHAIILDAASLSRKELYVALTRGSKSITIISSSNTLPVV